MDGHNFSFWRGRFLDTFDPPLQAMTSVELMELYQRRQKWLTRGAKSFGTGHWKDERLCSEILKDLALGKSYFFTKASVIMKQFETKFSADLDRLSALP